MPAEQPDAVLPAGLHQQVEELRLVGRLDPELVAEVAGEGDPPDERGDHADVETADVQEPERLVRHVRGRE